MLLLKLYLLRNIVSNFLLHKVNENFDYSDFSIVHHTVFGLLPGYEPLW